jgi:cell division protein FtsB
MTDVQSRTAARPPQSPRPGRARRLVQALLWVGAAVLLIESLFGARGLTAMLEARRQHQVLQGSLERLKAENAHLRFESRRLREDLSAVEEAARRDLQFIAPGEKVFIIRDAKPK